MRPSSARIGGAGGEDFRLAGGVQLEETVLALDDLERRADVRRLESDVGHPEHLVSGGHLDEELGHAGERDVALRRGRDVGRALGLEPVDEGVGPQRHVAHATLRAIPNGVM